ncbi:SDR family oxidoreductase [Nakamurella sp. YIM 132087]|uniref:SDR family oxidoreductase n=1 Tax=Nakamurella alba TaxID=2665158 RepID=A0A7K1FE18_9ACTN|nr:SDR family oxidoreductase [Nakamurella alba]MTD12347.1 SDR family oxidoreductase [Nakamurella alba]
MSPRRYLLGASTAGLGLAVARALVTRGDEVAICGRSAYKLAGALALLGEIPGGGRAVGEVVDLTDPDAAAGWPARAAGLLDGPLSGVLVNTGGPAPRPFDACTAQDWADGIAAVLTPAVTLARESRPLLEPAASVVFSTSTVVREPALSPDLVISACLRSAVATLAKVLSREWAPQVRVNHVVPGRIETDRVLTLDRVRAERSGRTAEEVAADSHQAIPLGRYGEPGEFAAAVAWLLGPESSYVSGATLPVDGGLLTGV